MHKKEKKRGFESSLSLIAYFLRGSAAFFLLCDDLERELGDTKKAEKCRKLANENGWVPVSMRDDFKTIYGKDVTRNDKK